MVFLVDEELDEFIPIGPSLALEHAITALLIVDFRNHAAMFHVPRSLKVSIFITGVIEVAATLQNQRFQPLLAKLFSRPSTGYA